MEHIKSKDVEVGDILAVKCKENFPCDLIILAASSLKGKCYVMTANLDGESNLNLNFNVNSGLNQWIYIRITISFLAWYANVTHEKHSPTRVVRLLIKQGCQNRSFL